MPQPLPFFNLKEIWPICYSNPFWKSNNDKYPQPKNCLIIRRKYEEMGNSVSPPGRRGAFSDLIFFLHIRIDNAYHFHSIAPSGILRSFGVINDFLISRNFRTPISNRAPSFFSEIFWWKTCSTCTYSKSISLLWDPIGARSRPRITVFPVFGENMKNTPLIWTPSGSTTMTNTKVFDTASDPPWQVF